MGNHIQRARERRDPERRYLAEVSGSSYAQYAHKGNVVTNTEAYFATITEARKWAESLGTTASACYITDTWKTVGDIHPLVGLHRRELARVGHGTGWYADGTRWYRLRL